MIPRKLHFWLRVEGDVGCEVFAPRPLAKLDTGETVRYHLACVNLNEGAEFCAAGCFHWRYLGRGQAHTINGIMQFAPAAGRANLLGATS